MLTFDLETIKRKVDYLVSKEEIDEIRHELKNYVPLIHFNDLAGDFGKLST